MEAFRRLIDEGLIVAQVASRFGVSALTVERRLKLARLAPRFLAMYRADEIGSEQLQAPVADRAPRRPRKPSGTDPDEGDDELIEEQLC